MAFAIDGLLLLAVLMAWLGCLGFARLRTPLDRLHCVAFVNATTGVAVLLAAWLEDGASIRCCKVLLIIGIALVSGGAMSHATGRAVLQRGAGPPAEAGETS